MENIKPVSVVCAIIIRNGRFLAALRSEGQSRGGLWEFPGGKIHRGESPAQALIREIREELGVNIAVLDQLPTNVCHYSDISITLIPFAAKITDDKQPSAHEHDKIRWVDCAEAQKLDWAPADIPILRSLCENRKNHGL